MKDSFTRRQMFLAGIGAGVLATQSIPQIPDILHALGVITDQTPPVQFLFEGRETVTTRQFNEQFDLVFKDGKPHMNEATSSDIDRTYERGEFFYEKRRNGFFNTIYKTE